MLTWVVGLEKQQATTQTVVCIDPTSATVTILEFEFGQNQ